MSFPALCSKSRSMKPSSEPKIPIWIWLDPTRRCNLACSLCYTKESHSAQDLSLTTLRAVLDRLEQSQHFAAQELTFNWRGEPMMNRRFEDLLEIILASEIGCRIQFHTNGMLITSKRAKRLAQMRGDLTVYISIDGGSRSSHDRNRGAGSFDRAIAGANRLLDERGEQPFPRISVYQLDLLEHDHQYDPAFLALCERADEVVVASPVLPDGDGRPFLTGERLKGGTSIVDEWSQLPRDYPVPRGPCFFAGNALVIAPDGSVSICILSNDARGIVGNISTDSLDDIYDRTASWRELLVTQGRTAIPHCADCRKCEGEARPKSVLDRAGEGCSEMTQ